MKYCPNCGTQLPDSAAFCGVCGNALPTAQPEDYAQTYTDPYTYTQTCVEPYPESAPQQPVKKKKTWLWVTLGVVTVLVVAAVVGFFTNWFGLASPLSGLLKAATKTGTADNLTAKVTIKYTDEDGETEKETGTYRVVMDEKNEKIYYIAEADGSTILFDDGDVYYYSEAEDEDDYDYAYVSESEESAGKEYFDAYKDIYDGKKINWDELVEYAELEDYLNGNKMEDFVKEVQKEYLNDSEWLEKNLGFEKKGKTYTFEPNFKRLSKEVTNIVGDSRAFTSKGKEVVEEAMDDVKGGDVSLTVSITVDGGYITEIVCKMSDEDYRIEYTIEITDVNKTEITSKDRSAIRDKVEQLIDENTCDTCGETLWFYDEDEYHGDCSFCDDHGDLSYTVDGEPSCYECYYDATHRCEKCGDTDGYSSYSYGSYDMLCYDCYYDLKYMKTCELCGSKDTYLWSYYGYDLCWDCYYELKY